MTREDFRDTVRRALASEIAEGTDPDALKAELDDAVQRIDAAAAALGGDV